MNTNKKFDVKIMVETALCAALLCVLSPFSIPLPFSPVPISLSILAIYISLYTLGMKWGTVSVLIYILLGLVGIPVFANFTAGPGKLFGPTGGYIIGYIFLALIAGFFIDKFEKKLYMHAIGMLLGVTVCYAFGTAWFLKVMSDYTFAAAMTACVIPFIPADIAKIVLALIFGPIIRKAVKKINA